MYPKDIKALLDKDVYGQHQAKKALSLLGFNALRSFNDESSLSFKHAFLIGPTGCGKTALVQSFVKHLNIPYILVNAQSITPDGWHGRDLVSIIKELKNKYPTIALNQLEHAVIFIDEIDKIAATGDPQHVAHYRQVQSCYLKLLEGDIISGFDTSKLTFIAAGAFSNLKDLPTNNPIGYTFFEEPNKLDPFKLKRQVIEYGFLEEFIARFGFITQLENLTWQDYREILTLGELSIINEYINFFELDQESLYITSTGLEEIAKEAEKQQLGVRGLRALVHQVLTEHMFNIGYNKDSRAITVTGDIVKTLMKG